MVSAGPAIVTPWPPQASGIADYAAALAAGLRRSGEEVTVYTRAENPTPVEGVRIENARTLPARAHRHGVVVYQVGNNACYHAEMAEMIKVTGGVVHLHDFVLQHLFCHYWQSGQKERYLEMIERWYGPEARRTCAELLRRGTPPWGHPVALDVPLCEEVLCHSSSAIVHSRYAAARIHRRLPGLTVYEVPQTYPVPAADSRSRNGRPAERVEEIEVVSLGHVIPNKCLDVVLEAMKNISDPRLRLRVVGEVSPACRPLREQAEAELKGRVVWEGWLPMEKYLEIIAGADLIVNLRHPSMGEVSAVCMRALQGGVPVLVADSAWYAELPDAVPKVRVENMKGEVQAFLTRFVRDPVFRKELRAGAAALARTLPTHEESIERYREILERIAYGPSVP
jgi:glycosyltransferase involved in cell wall biosynthesis